MQNANDDGRWSKTHILLCDLTHCELRSKIAWPPFGFIAKHLTSTKAGNWRQAANLIKAIREWNDALGAVIVQLTQTCLLQCAHDGYLAAWQKIVDELQAEKGIVFVHEHNLQGMWNACIDKRYPVTARSMRVGAEVIANLQASGITVLPYKKRTDLVLAIARHLQEMRGGAREA